MNILNLYLQYQPNKESDSLSLCLQGQMPFTNLQTAVQLYIIRASLLVRDEEMPSNYNFNLNSLQAIMARW